MITSRAWFIFWSSPENASHRRGAGTVFGSIPGSQIPIERVGGAVIDVQYHTHQGYTYWYASFWVGANAMLRMTALNAIRERVKVNGKMVVIYIQDRTVIEDTESTIDLVHKGWMIYNYPARMTFSAMPSDFGSLLIQRRRWANGGLIIIPKLLHYAFRAPEELPPAQGILHAFQLSGDDHAQHRRDAAFRLLQLSARASALRFSSMPTSRCCCFMPAT